MERNDRHSVLFQYGPNAEQVLDGMARAGYKKASLGFSATRFFYEDGWEREVIRARKLLERYGLQCAETHLNYTDLKLSSEIPDPGTELAQERCVIATEMLGADWTAFHFRTAIHDNYSPRRSLEHNRPQLERLVRCAEAHHTGVAVENLSIFPDVYWMRFLGSDVEDLVWICQEIDSPSLGICFDFGHAHLMKHDLPKMVRTVGPWLRCTHIHDNYQLQDDHAIPTNGNLDWSAAMAALKEVGYEGNLTQELVLPKEPQLLNSFLAHSRACGQYLERLIK